MEPILQESAISVTNVYKSSQQQIPSWIIKKAQVILQLNKLPKIKPHPSTYLDKFQTILLHHLDHRYIFTDGSKDSNKTACTAVLNKTIHKKALPMKSPIITAEVCAIDLALSIISENKYSKFIIFSDIYSLHNKEKIWQIKRRYIVLIPTFF